MPDPRRLYHEIAVLVVTQFLADLPFSVRSALPEGSAFVPQVTVALERTWRRRPLRRREAERDGHRAMERLVFASLFDPAHPTAQPYILEQAIKLAEQVLRARDAQFRSEYGDGVIDLGAAPSFGWSGLLELADEIARGRVVENPIGLLKRIIQRHARLMVDQAMRAIAPEKRARYLTRRRLLTELAETHPHLSEEQRRRLATELADLAALAELLRRRLLAENEATQPGDGFDPHQAAVDNELVRVIEARIEHPPFTDVDRLTWRLFKAAGYDGRGIDWERECGISRAAGSQRLYSFLRKLRGALGPGWPM
jgi:hypothetical protein